jgi:arginine exporter protein ArgO
MGVACADTLLAILAFSVYSLLKSYIDEYNTLIQICGGVFVVIVGIFIFFKNPVPQIRKNRAGHSVLWQDFASMFGFTLANFAIIIPYILAFFTMFNVELSSSDPMEHAKEVAVEESGDKDYLDDAGLLSYSDEALARDNFGIITKHEERKIEEAVQRAEEEAKVHSEEYVKIPRMIRNLLVLGGFLLGAMVWWTGLTSLINLFRRGFKPRHLIVINRIAGIIISALGVYSLISVIIDL